MYLSDVIVPSTMAIFVLNLDEIAAQHMIFSENFGFETVGREPFLCHTGVVLRLTSM